MTYKSMKSLGVVGGGAWGTALGCVAVRAGRQTLLWARNTEVVAEITHHHRNSLYLPDIRLDTDLVATEDMADLAEMDALLLACPAQHMRTIARLLKPHIPASTPLVICAKGIERQSGALMHAVLADEMPDNPVAVLSGPNFAAEVARDLPAAVTLAAADEELGLALSYAIGTPMFRPYYSDDIVGAQIGGAVKNVLAIASGLVSGLALGENARAALITRGLAEMTRFAIALGGHRETMAGLSGMGDLILTCSSEQSRNMSFGKALGEGRKASAILAERRSVSEGVWSAAIVQKMAHNAGVDMPIVDAVVDLLESDAPVKSVVQALLSRPFKREEI